MRRSPGGASLSRHRERFLSTARDRPWLLVLPVVFTLVSGRYFASFAASPGSLGYDARVYSLAARAMLEGRNPWTVELDGGTIVGPPTTLIPYLPFAYLPQELSAAIWIVGSFLIAAVFLQALGLAPWWLAFPPLFHPLLLGNEEILMVGLLVLGGRRLAGLAPLLKPYALIPLVVERRWTAAALGAGLGLGSLVVLPWATFVQSLPLIRERIVSQNFGDNAYGDLPLVAIAFVALLSLGAARGAWFATPVLWPYAQTHYGLMALPIMPPILGLIWALPIPEAITVGIVFLAVAERFARQRGWTLERAPATGLAGWLRPPRRPPDWTAEPVRRPDQGGRPVSSAT